MDPKRIFNYARETDTILIINGNENSVDKTFYYLTEAKSGIFEGSMLIVKPDSITIVTSQLEEEAARETGHRVIIANSRKEFDDTLKRELSDVDVIGLNYSTLSLEQYIRLMRTIPEKRFINVSASISECRRIKQESEIEKIKEAAKIASEAFEKFIEKLHDGMTERELAAEVVHEMMLLGAEGPSFDSIVAFGKNSALPHYTPQDAKLKRGDFVLIDFGAYYNRYASDITRTVVYGRATEEQKLMYETVLRAQEESMKAIKENVNGKDVDLIARKIIDDSQFKGRFIHSLGHGVGMDVHDHPALSPSYDFTLKENMVITNEPGIYVPGVGGVRIEDDVVVKKNGHEVITSATKELLELS